MSGGSSLGGRVDAFVRDHGSARPPASGLQDAEARDVPLAAFAVLTGGAVFEGGTKPAQGEARAAQLFARAVRVGAAEPELLARIQHDYARQLGSNPALLERMARAKPLQVDVVPEGASMASFGYPKGPSRRAVGLFWDHPSWPVARVAFLARALRDDPLVVHHELAHAIHALAFTKEERRVIEGVLAPTFGGGAGVDEAFAIYSERELVGQFTDLQKRVPGVYGFARSQWAEEHVFTRFVRKLYFPHLPLAGPGMPPAGGGDWMRRLGR